MRPSLSKKQEKIIYWILAGVVLAFVLGYVVLKITGISIQLPMCTLLKWTGLYCPGCGGTRACVCLMEGNVKASFYYHPIVLYGALISGWYLLSHTIEYLSKGRISIGMRYRDIYLYIAILILLVNWFVKNACLIFAGIRLI